MNCRRCGQPTVDGICPDCSTFCLYPRSDAAPDATVVTPQGAEFSSDLLAAMALSRGRLAEIVEDPNNFAAVTIRRGYNRLVARLDFNANGGHSLHYRGEGATVAEAVANLEYDVGRAAA
jgi:hypothetical protein